MTQINQQALSTQYQQIGKSYLENKARFYQKTSDGARDFIMQQLQERATSLNGNTLLDIGCGGCGDIQKYSSDKNMVF